MNRTQESKQSKLWKVGALSLALFALPMFSAPASADGFSIGAIFRIGGVHFNLAFGDFGYGHPRGYYYRTLDPISYGGYRCSDSCFNSGGYHYHHESCPLVQRHLSAYGIDPYVLFDSYAPYNDGYAYYGYGNRYDRYNRYDNYNRYDRYPRHDRYDGRYDRHDRYDGRDRHDRYDRRDRHDRYDGRRDRHGRYDNYPYRDRRQGHSGGSHDGHHDGHHRGQSSERPQQH